MPQPRVCFELWEVNSRLSELGLDEERLNRAVKRGLAQWATHTPNHPPVAAGFNAWAETVAALRDELLPIGWERSNEANLPLTVNTDKSIAICVNTGDERTGCKNGIPCTLSSKGTQTRRAIQENLGQTVLFMETMESAPREADRNGRAVWVLLIHRDLRNREVRAELSRPISISEDGKIDGWLERIVLSHTSFDEDLISAIEGGNGPQSPEINIEIAKLA